MKIKTTHKVVTPMNSFWQTSGGDWYNTTAYSFTGVSTTSKTDQGFPRPHKIDVSGTFSVEEFEWEIEVK